MNLQYLIKFSVVLLYLGCAVSTYAAEPHDIHDQLAVPGCLYVVGGARLPESVQKSFFERAGGAGKAKIVVIPTASVDAEDPTQAESFTKRWQDLKPASVTLLHTKSREQADSEEFVKPIREATAVWFSGGDQRRIVAVYAGTRTHTEIQKLLAERDGVVGGTSAGAAIMSDPMITGGTSVPTIGPGMGFLPGVLCDQHFVARKRAERLRYAIARAPATVGMGIDESTAAMISGRTIHVLGNSTVTIVWAKGQGAHGPEAHELVLKSGEVADLFQIRRAAIARANGLADQFHRPPVPLVPHGQLLIVGGGELPKSIVDRFFELAGGRDSKIVFVPTAGTYESGDPEPTDYKILKQAGANNLVMLHTRDRKTANDPEFANQLQDAKAVWFSGGRQWRLVDAYANTATETQFHEVLKRGGTIAGTSAGASIQSQFMPRGHPLGNKIIQAEGYEQGFGFLPGCAVDQHFFAQQRTENMSSLMQTYPKLLGIGIDEATAIVVTNGVAEVLGRSRVAFYDTMKTTLENGIDYETLTDGQKYDLVHRKRIAP